MTPDRTIRPEKPGHGEKESRTRERAIAALLSAKNLETAARASGVSRSTLGRWLQETAILDAYRLASRQVLEASIARLQGGTGSAVETLTRNLTCRKPSIEVQAARAILEHAVRCIEFLEFEDRLRAVEKSVLLREGKAR